MPIRAGAGLSGGYAIPAGKPKLKLPEAAGAKLRSSTISGTIDCGFTIKDRTGEKPVVGQDMGGTIGGGAGTVNLRTINGSITLKAVK